MATDQRKVWRIKALPTFILLIGLQIWLSESQTVTPTPSQPNQNNIDGTTAATTKRPTTTVPSTTPGIEYWTLEKGLETQPYWLATVITVPTNQDIRDLLFIIELEQGFAEAYQEGMQRESQENREIQELLQQLDPDINPLVMDRRKKRATSHGSYTVQMIDQIRDNLTPTSVSLVFYVTEGGTKYRRVAAPTSSAIYGRLSLSELTFFVGYPMESEVKDYNAMINPTGTPVPPAQSNNLWIIAAVLVPFFVIFLCVCCCCCMMMQKKRDTDIDPDTLKIIQFKQKYPYRPYQPANTPRGFDVAKNGIDNQGMVAGDGTATTKTGFHVENDLDDGLTRSAPKTDGFIPSETDSSINMENDIAATQKRPLPPRGTKNGGLFDGQPPPYPGRLPPLNTEDTKKSKQKKKRRRKKGVGPSDVDESTTGRTAADEDHPSSEFKPTSLDGLPETHLSRPPLPSSTDDENSQELDSETQKRLQSLFDDANPLADNAELTEDHAQMPSLIHVESSDPSQVYGTKNDLFAKKEGPKILIVPVTKVPDNGGGVVWSTYDAFDEVDKITTKKEPSSSPRNKNEPKPLTLTSPHTGAELTLQISETPREPSKDKVKEGTTANRSDASTDDKTPADKKQLPNSSTTRPLTISQLLATTIRKPRSKPDDRSQDTSLDRNQGELSGNDMTESLEMGTQWAQPALMDTVESDEEKPDKTTQETSKPPKLNWSFNASTPREEMFETKTPREHVELDMLSSSKLERTVGKPKGEDYDEMDIARSVKTGENPQPLIRVIREELVRLQRKGAPDTDV
ncbi:muscle M-line assembly protein unc-89-like isoform X2 [Ptychodera flava]|uniref:muscle M-line assembly protein unc-89-like isoform X2 n=1 Tax=Ptychodera flava TaxID=63121 RepID=UPI003969BDF0